MAGKVKRKRADYLPRRFAILALVVLVGSCIAGFLFPHNVNWYPSSLLSQDSRCFIPLSERSARVTFLSDMVLQHQATDAEWQRAYESERMQARLSFVAIFGVLLIALLRPSAPHNRSGIFLVAAVLFLGFYWFDIHTAEYCHRQACEKGSLDTTMTLISRLQIHDSTWYNVDYQKLTPWRDSVNTNKSRLTREFSNFVHPSQMVFYYLPSIVLLFLYLWLDRKQKRRSEADPWSSC